MPFIGNQPALSYTSFAKQDFTTSATTSYTLDNPVANANELALFINFVRQEPTTAYSASGTTLTLTSATSSSDDMYCVYLGKAVQTVNPPNASVGTSQLASSLDFSSKTITLASNMTNAPSFLAYRSTNQDITDNTITKVEFDTEDFDTDNCYDNSTNYRFTPTVRGKYFVYASCRGDAKSDSQIQYHTIFIYKNGSQVAKQTQNFQANYPRIMNVPISYVVDMNGSTDYLEIHYSQQDISGNPRIEGASTGTTFFGAYKLIGV